MRITEKELERITDFQKRCSLCYDEIYPPELTKEELEDIGEMQRGEADYEAKRIEELEKCGK